MKKIVTMILIIFLLVACQNSNTITGQEAKTIVQDMVGGEFMDINQTKKDGKEVYVIRMIKDGVVHTLMIDMKGTIVDHVQVPMNTKDSSFITLEEAKNMAIQQVGGGAIKSVELKKDADETVHYDIEVSYDSHHYELSVNALTGEILTFIQE